MILSLLVTSEIVESFIESIVGESSILFKECKFSIVFTSSSRLIYTEKDNSVLLLGENLSLNTLGFIGEEYPGKFVVLRILALATASW